MEARDAPGQQVGNICGIIRGTAASVVSGREELNAPKVTAAAKEAAATGKVVGIV